MGYIVNNTNPIYSITYCRLECVLILSCSLHFDFLSGSFHKAYRKVKCSSRLSRACCKFRQSLIIAWTYFLYHEKFLRSRRSPNATVQYVVPIYVRPSVRPSVRNLVSVTNFRRIFTKFATQVFFTKSVQQKFLYI
jgi:hypothetical protein